METKYILIFIRTARSYLNSLTGYIILKHTICDGLAAVDKEGWGLDGVALFQTTLVVFFLFLWRSASCNCVCVYVCVCMCVIVFHSLFVMLLMYTCSVCACDWVSSNDLYGSIITTAQHTPVACVRTTGLALMTCMVALPLQPDTHL